MNGNINLSDRNYDNVVVFGQGFVGLPLALSFAFRGCNVYGVDVIDKLVQDINNGVTHHTESFEGKTIQEILREQLSKGNYRATTDMAAALRECNNIIVTVGIPIKNRKHDTSDLMNCIEIIGKNLKKGDLVVIRSTVIPGITESEVLPMLEKQSGMKAGDDFYLAYSSERIAEGHAFDEFAYMPTIVGGINEQSALMAKKLLSIVCKADVIIASDMKVVETAKVFENVQRDVNLAMVQEFARFCEALGIDIFEVIKVANTHKRVNLLTPGPGVGGYCIPNAYYYLEPRADELGIDLDVLRISRTKNENLPNVMVSLLEDRLNKEGKKLAGANIGILGLAMKDYSNDDRISPPIEIIKNLINKGANVYAYDSVVPTMYDFKVENIEDALRGMDSVMILAKQRDFEKLDFSFLAKNLKCGCIVFDTKNLFSHFKGDFKENGIIYMSI